LIIFFTILPTNHQVQLSGNNFKYMSPEQNTSPQGELNFVTPNLDEENVHTSQESTDKKIEHIRMFLSRKRRSIAVGTEMQRDRVGGDAHRDASDWHSVSEYRPLTPAGDSGPTLYIMNDGSLLFCEDGVRDGINADCVVVDPKKINSVDDFMKVWGKE